MYPLLFGPSLLAINDRFANCKILTEGIIANSTITFGRDTDFWNLQTSGVPSNSYGLIRKDSGPMSCKKNRLAMSWRVRFLRLATAVSALSS